MKKAFLLFLCLLLALPALLQAQAVDGEALALETLADLAAALVLTAWAFWGLLTGTDVFEAMLDGIRQGLTTLLRILPPLIALLTAVYMLRASGALEALTELLRPALELLGIPPETAPLMLLRPISGSGAMAAASELMQSFGPDSYVGRTAAVMLGSTETTFYVVAVYFGAAGVRRTRWAVPAALCADLAGFAASALAVRLFFG